MTPPEKILKPEQVHFSHEVYDEGWTISDPVCCKCRASVYDNPELLTIPCEGKQGELFSD